MLLQVGRVFTLQHRGTAAAAVRTGHLADAHVGIGEVLEVFPDGAAATSSHVLGMPAPDDGKTTTTRNRVRPNTESVNFWMEALDVFLQIG